MEVLEILFKNKSTLVIHDVKYTRAMTNYCSLIVESDTTFYYKNELLKKYTFNLSEIESVKKNNKLMYLNRFK